jgi:hypothetical protein
MILTMKRIQIKQKIYNEYLSYKNEKYQVVHKDGETKWAVRIGSKGLVGGPVLKFVNGFVV